MKSGNVSLFSVDTCHTNGEPGGYMIDGHQDQYQTNSIYACCELCKQKQKCDFWQYTVSNGICRTFGEAAETDDTLIGVVRGFPLTFALVLEMCYFN
eukprot:TRINITY_DN10001_c0_g1_i2.p2 TRINITY_DN10001_c0_g1~~TRINITY_DN10001_c0_g1_i2.p2  ORF type:complete len:97 (+),score=7.66 TRINITY_DN10001_c0_g1_i2:80-370(+)